MYGYTSEEVLWRHSSFLLLAENRVEREQILARIGQGERIEPYGTRRLHKDGQVISVADRLAYYPRCRGRDHGAPPLSLATSPSRCAPRRRSPASPYLDLQRSNAELERFAHLFYHDLQEPLRTVTNGASRLRQLIEGLLCYACVQTRGDAFEPVSLEEILAETLGFQLALEESGAAVTLGPLALVHANSAQMGQVLANLIDNAQVPGRRSPPAHLTAERRGDEWVVSIRDNQIGIDLRF